MFRKDYWITCDECNDTAWCDGQTQRSAVKYARTLGWSVGKKHLCPRCHTPDRTTSADAAKSFTHKRPQPDTTPPKRR